MGWFDKGLLGSAAGNNNPAMGLLGSAQKPSGWDIASLIASGLQDANAGYRGQPGGNLDSTMQDMQTHHMRRALMEGLQSEDPALRQKAYSAAAMLGIDTKPFQQQQVSQQLPQLLASMKPSQQTLAGASARLNDGSQLNAAPIGFEAPGLNISDAITKAPPELQAQYAPKLLDEELKGPQYHAVGKDLYQLPRLGDGAPTLAVAGPKEAPKSRTIQRGSSKVEQQFNERTGQFEDIPGATGPAWKPDKPAAPAASIGIPNPAFKFRSRR